MPQTQKDLKITDLQYSHPGNISPRKVNMNLRQPVEGRTAFLRQNLINVLYIHQMSTFFTLSDPNRMIWYECVTSDFKRSMYVSLGQSAFSAHAIQLLFINPEDNSYIGKRKLIRSKFSTMLPEKITSGYTAISTHRWLGFYE